MDLRAWCWHRIAQTLPIGDRDPIQKDRHVLSQGPVFIHHISPQERKSGEHVVQDFTDRVPLCLCARARYVTSQIGSKIDDSHDVSIRDPDYSRPDDVNTPQPRSTPGAPNLHSEIDRAFQQAGWVLFDHDPAVLQWIHHALPAARQTLKDSAHRHGWRHGQTWFVGVNALDNDRYGAVGNGPALTGRALTYLAGTSAFRELPLDKAQISVCLPGYPARSDEESAASHRYRQHQDAAHLDGLLRRGSNRRRYLGEHHAYILGIPLVDVPAGASPLVVWEGSHRMAQQWFRRLLADREVSTWKDLDLTDAYHALRREIFERCPRREIHAQPGQCYLLHRMALHGIAPWRADSRAGPDGRMICYFRPELPDPRTWLQWP